MITRHVAIEKLKKYINCELSDFAKHYGITISKNGKYNKGWKGQTLEYLCGLESNNKQAPNGLGFELKSTAFKKVKGLWVPKETAAITMIEENSLKTKPFLESHCWEKLKSLVFCAVSWDGKNCETGTLLNVHALDLEEREDIINVLSSDYEVIQDKLLKHGWSGLTGKDGFYIQARTKGPGHGSTTRAFYARKRFLSLMIDSCNTP